MTVSEEEVDQIKGMYLQMKLMDALSVRCYWERESMYRKIDDIMSRNCFEDIVRNLHFTNNLDTTKKQRKDEAWKMQAIDSSNE
ncbi:hypothetical protein HPB47_022584 [Ixodes persulcatus]|uniref:Uncharacterized protein n=1 Tax=Ixodes persulcatus TaxID=34615 RepID=A0AC60QCL4_IXOPE|nr:hypothetical protein HPB47_022584 [Ixodes persulcatus]